MKAVQFKIPKNCKSLKVLINIKGIGVFSRVYENNSPDFIDNVIKGLNETTDGLKQKFGLTSEDFDFELKYTI